jgi:hypothetical protein
MVRSVDLHGGANLGTMPYVNRHPIKQDAVEVEEDTAAQVNVVPIVTEEGWADDGLSNAAHSSGSLLPFSNASCDPVWRRSATSSRSFAL